MNIVKMAMEGHLENKGPALSLEELAVIEDELATSQDQIVAQFEETENALNVVSALEDLAYVADTIKQTTPQEAALIQIAVDATMNGTGVDGASVFPAMEANEDGKGIVQRIREIVRRIVEGIKEMLGSIVKAIISSVVKGIVAASTQEAAAKRQLQEIEKNLKSLKKDVNGKVSVHPLFDGEKGLVKPVAIGDALKRYEVMVERFSKDSFSIAKQLCDLVRKSYGPDGLKAMPVVVAIGTTSGFRDIAQGGMRVVDQGVTEEGTLKYADGTYQRDSELHLGGIKITTSSMEITTKGIMICAESSEKAAQTLRRIMENNHVYARQGSYDKPAIEDIPLPKVEELKDLVKSVQSLMSLCSKETDSKSLASSAKRTVEMVEDTCNYLTERLKKLEGAQDKEIIPFIQEALRISNGMSSRLASSHSVILYNSLKVARATMDYVGRCIIEYKAPTGMKS